MSFITLLMIKDRKIRHLRNHYSEIIRMLESGIKARDFIDAGYIIVDYDSKTIVDRQSCFSISSLSGEIKKKSSGMKIL